MGSYAKTPENTVKRYAPRAVYDVDTIHPLFNAQPLLHVAFPAPAAQSAAPALLPMIGVIATYAADDRPHLYLHGHVSSRLFRLARAGALPVSACATRLDGLVCSLTPFSHSMNYASAVVFGTASLVGAAAATDTDTDNDDNDDDNGDENDDENNTADAPGAAEKLWALEQLTEKVLPGRWDNSRVPPTRAELATTHVLKVAIASASAKTRAGGPSDERRDRRDEAVVERVWTGVLPCAEVYQPPVPSSYCRGTLPSYVDEYVAGRNREYVERAVRSAGVEYKTKA